MVILPAIGIVRVIYIGLSVAPFIFFFVETFALGTFDFPILVIPQSLVIIDCYSLHHSEYKNAFGFEREESPRDDELIENLFGTLMFLGLNQRSSVPVASIWSPFSGIPNIFSLLSQGRKGNLGS
jgi:hypothetical protein